MDFTLKVVGGDISAIPGVADALEVRVSFLHPINLVCDVCRFNKRFTCLCRVPYKMLLRIQSHGRFEKLFPLFLEIIGIDETYKQVYFEKNRSGKMGRLVRLG